MEKELNDARELFESITTTSVSGIFVFNEKITYSNLEFQKLLGFTQKELLDKNFVDLFYGEFKERAMSSGKNSTFKEAKQGLKLGKKVCSAKITIEYNGEEWSFLIKSEDFSMSSFKTPKISKKIQQDEDPEGVFFEKIFLIEKALELFDDVFYEFLKIKFDPAWEEELEEMRQWIKQD